MTSERLTSEQVNKMRLRQLGEFARKYNASHVVLHDTDRLFIGFDRFPSNESLSYARDQLDVM